MRRPLLAAAVAAALLAPAAAAYAAHTQAPVRTLVVAPHGDDSAAGTAAHPLRTIQLAVRRLRDGGQVLLKGGRYAQRIDLTGTHDLVVAPFRGQHPVLDGASLVPHGTSAMVTIARAEHLTVRGLEITGYRTRRLGVVPIGIYVHGYDQDVRIAGNHVHDMGNLNGTRGSFDINAHGIAVYGDDPHGAVSGLRIEGNRVDHLRLGASESVVVNGNVRNWRIVGNRVFANDNIGIDAIGFEETLSGRYRYTERNRARYGLIADNTVAHIRSRGNPSYYEDGGWCNCADGIYVDGGTHIVIRGNRVRSNDIGVEVAAENGRGAADHVLVTHNRISGSLFTGIATGGYCDGANGCGGVRTGTSHDNRFTFNTLKGDNQLDDGSPEVLVQYHAYRDRFAHNTITATNRGRVVYGTVPRSDSHANTSDHNRFGGTPGGAEFGWDGRTYTGFVAYRRATGEDAHSRFVR